MVYTPSEGKIIEQKTIFEFTAEECERRVGHYWSKLYDPNDSLQLTHTGNGSRSKEFSNDGKYRICKLCGKRQKLSIQHVETWKNA